MLLAAVYLVNTSRTGRAWRSLREDSLAAEMMGMPVNRLRLLAFACGAGVAGLTGTLFASLNTAVFAADFDVPLLITVYAMLILGGAGSLGGVILGALVVNVSLEALRTPNHATWIVFVLVLGTLIAKLRPWQWLVGVLVGTVVVRLRRTRAARRLLAERDARRGLRRRPLRGRPRALAAAADGRAGRRQLGVRRPGRARALHDDGAAASSATCC